MVTLKIEKCSINTSAFHNFPYASQATKRSSDVNLTRKSKGSAREEINHDDDDVFEDDENTIMEVTEELGKVTEPNLNKAPTSDFKGNSWSNVVRKQSSNKNANIQSNAQKSNSGTKKKINWKTLAIVGTASSSELVRVPRLHHFKVGRFHKDTTAQLVYDHLKKFADTSELLKVEEIPLRMGSYFKLFHVMIEDHLAGSINDPTNWGSGIEVQRYFSSLGKSL